MTRAESEQAYAIFASVNRCFRFPCGLGRPRPAPACLRKGENGGGRHSEQIGHVTLDRAHDRQPARHDHFEPAFSMTLITSPHTSAVLIIHFHFAGDFGSLSRKLRLKSVSTGPGQCQRGQSSQRGLSLDSKRAIVFPLRSFRSDCSYK